MGIWARFVIVITYTHFPTGTYPIAATTSSTLGPSSVTCSPPVYIGFDSGHIDVSLRPDMPDPGWVRYIEDVNARDVVISITSFLVVRERIVIVEGHSPDCDERIGAMPRFDDINSKN